MLKTLFKEKSIKLPDEIGRSVPIYYRCMEHRDAKVRKYNSVICVFTSVSAVAMAAYIGLTVTAISSAIIFATITGIFALIIAVMISEMSKRYIENEFQKKMFMELVKYFKIVSFCLRIDQCKIWKVKCHDVYLINSHMNQAG